MKRVIVLGAGFSKAMGGLPLTSEMFDCFAKVLEHSRSQANRNRVFWGERIFAFLRWFEEQSMPRGLRSADTGERHRVLSTDFRTNFEFILSYIDMSMTLEVTATAEDGTETYEVPVSTVCPIEELDNLRGWIATYLFLALADPAPERDLLQRFREEFLRDDTVVITFNYDLILERFLYEQGLWYPHDGYGMGIDMPATQQPVRDLHTSIPVIKLHGSLNWTWGSGNRLGLKWHDDHQQPFFRGYLSNEKGLPFDWEGGHEAVGWVLPSWVKAIESFPLPMVWRRAARTLKEADEISVIGYSLPAADAAVVSLLSCVEFRCGRITVIDPHANDLAHRYRQITGLDVECQPKKLQDVLAQ